MSSLSTNVGFSPIVLTGFEYCHTASNLAFGKLRSSWYLCEGNPSATDRRFHILSTTGVPEGRTKVAPSRRSFVLDDRSSRSNRQAAGMLHGAESY